MNAFFWIKKYAELPSVRVNKDSPSSKETSEPLNIDEENFKKLFKNWEKIEKTDQGQITWFKNSLDKTLHETSIWILYFFYCHDDFVER